MEQKPSSEANIHSAI